MSQQAQAVDTGWYRPVCDHLLAKIERWDSHYERGKESASRKFVTTNGRIVDRVTRRAHRLRFKPVEVQHLVRLLDALIESRGLVADFQKVQQGLTNGKLIPGGEYEIELNFFKEDVTEILSVLRRAKSGRIKTIEQTAREQAESGKGLFEQ